MDVPFIEYYSNVDEDIEAARDKVKKICLMKKIMQETKGENNGENGDDNQNGNGDGGQTTNTEDGDARNIVRQGTNIGKVTDYESDYIESSVVLMKIPGKILLQMMQKGTGSAKRFMSLMSIWMISRGPWI